MWRMLFENNVLARSHDLRYLDNNTKSHLISGMDQKKVSPSDLESVKHFLSLCEFIENCFESVFPELFDSYFHNRLHGRHHVWNVLKWALEIGGNAHRHNCIDIGTIPMNDFVAALLLHDIGGLTIPGNQRVEHHIQAAEYIRPILQHAMQYKTYAFDIESVCTIARAHRLRRAFPPGNISEEIIALADGLDENIDRLHRGNRGGRAFFDDTLPLDHRMKVVRRRNLESEGISREDPRNDALMFMLDSLVRNSIDCNPWKLVLQPEKFPSLRITDSCWAEMGFEYFRRNYPVLIRVSKKGNNPAILSVINAFLSLAAETPEYKFLRKRHFVDIREESHENVQGISV
jgi:HD superfamily phosphodiesterase